MSEYVLGSSDREIERLAYQNEIWFEETAALWEKAGIGLGSAVADMGCGPGFVTEALARLVGLSGHVHAVDSSDKFASIVAEKAESASNISFYQSDVNSTPLSGATVDFVFARWLYCFLQEPEKAIAEAARILRPDGKIVILDYFNYLAADVFPQNPLISMLFEGFAKDVESHGGSWEVGARLPRLLIDEGFAVESLTPICRIGKPGSRVWKWVEYFTEVTAPRLVENRIWSKEQRQEFEGAWAKAAADPASFLFTPPMIGIIASKENC